MPGETYLDTSVLMALLCPEPETDWIFGWYRSSKDVPLLSAHWIRTELASALAIKQRSQQLNANEAELAWAAGLRILQTVKCVSVVDEDFEDAALLCRNAGSKMRGPDALHLSVAKRLGCSRIATLDVLLAEQARAAKITPIHFGP
jgi:uncharacterized protein